MTSLIHDANRPQNASRKTSTDLAHASWADKVGISLAVACAVLAIVLAVIEVSSETVSAIDLPPLTPLAEGSYWTGFSA